MSKKKSLKTVTMVTKNKQGCVLVKVPDRLTIIDRLELIIYSHFAP